MQTADMRKIGALLDSGAAYVVRGKLADQKMKPGDPEPAHLPTANAMRILKHKNSVQNLSTNNRHPAYNLVAMRDMFVGAIENVGFDPFFVFYSTQLQNAWYNAEFNRRRSVITIDATGLGLTIPGNKTYIFLYTICAKGKIGSYV